MPLTSEQITQATTIRDVVNENANQILVARDHVDTILQHHDLIDQATGTALLLRCKSNVNTASQTIADATA